MTTLLYLFNFVERHSTKTVCGLTLSMQRPNPNPPQPKNYVLCATCIQLPGAAVTFAANPGYTTVIFPKVMMYGEGFTWPAPPAPPPEAGPGEGQFFRVEISRYPPGYEGKTSEYYGVKIQFPWSELFAGILTEDSSGVIYGSDGSAMITMTIGIPTS